MDQTAVPWRADPSGAVYAGTGPDREHIGVMNTAELAEAAASAHNAELIRKRTEAAGPPVPVRAPFRNVRPLARAIMLAVLTAPDGTAVTAPFVIAATGRRPFRVIWVLGRLERWGWIRSASAGGTRIYRAVYATWWYEPRIGPILFPEGGPQEMWKLDATARAAGYEVVVAVRLTHGDDALVELPGQEEPVRWPTGLITAATGLRPEELPGKRLAVTVRETPEDGRTLSGFRVIGRE